MTWAADEFERGFRDEIGDDLGQLVRDSAILRWINEGQGKLQVYRQRTSALAWASAAVTVAMPSDFHHEEEIKPDLSSAVYPHRIWGRVLYFDDPSVVSSGAGTLFYWATWPSVSGVQVSLLPDLGDQACLSFALYRFFKRLASSRADYRLYAATSQGNGVDVNDLSDLAEQHLEDFKETRDALSDTESSPSTFYGD